MIVMGFAWPEFPCPAWVVQNWAALDVSVTAGGINWLECGTLICAGDVALEGGKAAPVPSNST
jgi:hypothetical protein